MNIDLSEIAIFYIKPNAVSYIKKRKGFHYHINYYLELAKSNPELQEILDNIDVELMLEHPSLVHKMLHLPLVKEQNIGLILTMVPQSVMPTNFFTALLPSNPTDFQMEILNKCKNPEYEFSDFGIFDETINGFRSLMQDEDYGIKNTYLIDCYFDKIKEISSRR